MGSKPVQSSREVGFRPAWNQKKPTMVRGNWKPSKHSKGWLKKHGFTNGLWRLEEREKNARSR